MNKNDEYKTYIFYGRYKIYDREYTIDRKCAIFTTTTTPKAAKRNIQHTLKGMHGYTLSVPCTLVDPIQRFRDEDVSKLRPAQVDDDGDKAIQLTMKF